MPSAFWGERGAANDDGNESGVDGQLGHVYRRVLGAVRLRLGTSLTKQGLESAQKPLLRGILFFDK